MRLRAPRLCKRTNPDRDRLLPESYRPFRASLRGVALAWGLVLTLWLLRLPAGTDRMQEIARAVQQGAAAYLRRQYLTIAVVAAVLFLGIGLWDDLGWGTAFGFLIGAVLSAAAGFAGMNVAVRANVRTAEAAKGGVSAALRVAFRAGSVTGLLVVGFALFGVAAYYGILTSWFDNSPEDATRDLIGLAFGGSLISVFARLGGGIFTKAADVGADLVGKIEAGIPEDDPRNPAVIADNVGDNVGDCAGMAADLFETYAVTAVAVMFLGAVSFPATGVVLYPACDRRCRDRRLRDRNVLRAHRAQRLHHQRALQGGSRRDVLSAVGFIPIMLRLRQWTASASATSTGARSSASLSPSCSSRSRSSTRALAGRPSKSISKASPTGHATNIIEGLAVGMQATAAPVIVIAAAIVGAEQLAGLYGIGVAVMAQLAMTGLIVALDAYGPVTDNAGGIAEMADLDESVRAVTDPLDAVGNTTKAVTKGYAIGSAGLAALVLFDGFTSELDNEGSRPSSSSPTAG